MQIYVLIRVFEDIYRQDKQIITASTNENVAFHKARELYAELRKTGNDFRIKNTVFYVCVYLDGTLTTCWELMEAQCSPSLARYYIHGPRKI